MNSESIKISDIIITETDAESNIIIESSEKLNIFHLKCIALGTLNLNSKNSQNCIFLLHSNKIIFFQFLIVNSAGSYDPLGIIIVNNKLFLESFVNLK